MCAPGKHAGGRRGVPTTPRREKGRAAYTSCELGQALFGQVEARQPVAL